MQDKENSVDGITLTDRAAAHVKNFLICEKTNIGLRVSVKPTGCSGYQYIVAPADTTTEQDKIFESQGVKVIVDKLSLPLLKGTKMDYLRQGLNEGFQFANPNVQQTCGCGESFSV